MSNRYVLILVSLNPDRTDAAGIKYPRSGYVESKRYHPDNNILNGLYGTLWGQTSSSAWLNTDPDAQWSVVKVEQSDEIQPLAPDHNLVKFRAGMVVHDGCRADCYKYLDANSPPEYKRKTAGVEVVTREQDNSVLVNGFESKAQTEKPASHAVNVGEKGMARACGYESHAVALGRGGEAVASGENGNAFAISDMASATANGYGTHAVATGRNGMAIAGDKGIAAALNSGGEGQVGPDGLLILGYLDETSKLRVKVGYVGEDVEPNVLYKVGESGQFEKVT